MPVASMHECSSQPGEETELLGHCRTDARGSPSRSYRGADMAVADNFVQLPVSQFEEAPGFTVGVVSQALRTKDRVLEGNRERRVVVTHFLAYLRGLVFGARQRF